MSAPITSTAATLAMLQQQLGDVAAEIAATYAPDYSLGGPAGSESFSLASYRQGLFQQQTQLIEQIAELQPFMLSHQLRVGGSILG